MQIDKNLEKKFSKHNIGDSPDYTGDAHAFDPVPRYITKRGLCNAAGGFDVTLYHPSTTKVLVDNTMVPADAVADTGRGHRVGDQVSVTGLAVRGTLTIPSGLDTCRVCFGVYSADQHFTDLWAHLPYLDDMRLPREIDNDERKLTKVMYKEYLINKNAAESVKMIDINLYKRFKTPRKISYDDQLVDEMSVDQADFKKNRYLLRIASDRSTGGLPGPLDPSLFPNFFGNFICYYTDA